MPIDQEHPGSLRVGYVLKRFPRFSETFILNELLALQNLGADLDVFSLLRPPQEARHANLSRLQAPVITLAELGKVAGSDLGIGLGNKTAEITSLLSEPGTQALFSGKSPQDIATLHFKAAMVATRARSRGISHLHAHFMSDATTVALLAARMMGGSFSFTAHARDIYHTYVNPVADAAMRRAKISEAAFVTTVSNYNAAHLCKLCPEATGRIVRHYNGIDLSAFTPAPLEKCVPGRIIAVGRLVEKKGFPVLIDACAQLRDRGVHFDCLIIGDGPLADMLARRVAELKLGSRVTLAGPQPQEDLMRTLETASVAALPCVVSESGDRDGLPTVLLEAMAKALPVVTTSVSGGPEIVADGETGRLCEPCDPTALADALQEVLENPDHAGRMGRAGRARAERLFDLSRNAATLVGHFNRVRQGSRARSDAA